MYSFYLHIQILIVSRICVIEIDRFLCNSWRTYLKVNSMLKWSNLSKILTLWLYNF